MAVEPDLEQCCGSRTGRKRAIEVPEQGECTAVDFLSWRHAAEGGRDRPCRQRNVVPLQRKRVSNPMLGLAGEHLADSVLPPWCGPFKADSNFIDRIIGGKGECVGRRNEPPWRIELHGQGIHVVEVVPLVAAVARNGQQPIVIAPPRQEASRLVADVPIDVGVYLVLARGAPPIQGSDECIPILGAHVVDAAEIRSHALMEPGGANGPEAARLRLLVNHRPVARETQVHRYRLGIADRNLLTNHV